jgi:hypothetical protein
MVCLWEWLMNFSRKDWTEVFLCRPQPWVERVRAGLLLRLGCHSFSLLLGAYTTTLLHSCMWIFRLVKTQTVRLPSCCHWIGWPPSRRAWLHHMCIN